MISTAQQQQHTNLSNFVIIKKLGEGSFSQVLKVRRKSDGVNYALKKVTLGKLTSKEKENALNEIRILASITHPNIIAYKEAFLEDNNRTLCIIMELAEGGDLLQLVDKHKKKNTCIPEKDLWHYFIQIVHGLKALHDLKICHRDIKGANLFLTTDGTVKLGDLNVSKIAKAGMMHTQTGTPYYASPEVWKDKPYDNRSDIWSLGCVLYEMATKQPPFKAATMDGLYQKVTKGLFTPLGRQFSPELNQVINDCLQVNHRVRPSCDKILNSSGVLKHTSRDLMEFAADQLDTKSEDLLCTIKLPRNMGMIASRLPEAQYNKPTLKRTNSMPAATPKYNAVLSENYSKLNVQKENKVQQSQNSENLIQRAHRIHDIAQRKALDTIREDQTAKEDDNIFNLNKKPPGGPIAVANHQQKRIKHPKVLYDVYKSNPKSVQNQNLKAQKENILTQNNSQVHDSQTPRLIAAKANMLPQLIKPGYHQPASAVGSNRRDLYRQESNGSKNYQPLPKLADVSSIVQMENQRAKRPHSMNRPQPYSREITHRSELSSQDHVSRIRRQIVSRELLQINQQQQANNVNYNNQDHVTNNYSKYEQSRIELRRANDDQQHNKRHHYRNMSSRPDILSHRSALDQRSQHVSSAAIGSHYQDNRNYVPTSLPSSRAGGISRVARLML